MIQFFRRIRQKLISERHLSKYVLYALGEILLVVAGILIALQINNWNQKRIDRVLEENYLERLHFEISRDTSFFKFQIARNQQRKSIIELFSASLIDTASSAPDLLIQAEAYFDQGWLLPVFNYHKSTYSDLNSTGKLSVIQNVELRDDVISLYREYEEFNEKFNLNEMWITPIDAVLSTETAALAYASKTKIIFGEEQSTMDLRLNKDLYLRGSASHYWMIHSAVEILDEVLVRAENILESIDKELK